MWAVWKIGWANFLQDYKTVFAKTIPAGRRFDIGVSRAAKQCRYVNRETFKGCPVDSGVGDLRKKHQLRFEQTE